MWQQLGDTIHKVCVGESGESMLIFKKNSRQIFLCVVWLEGWQMLTGLSVGPPL